MSEDMETKIRNLMSNDIARYIARFCKTPKTASEIISHIMRSRTSSDKDFYERITAETLITMEKLNAVTYAEGKWTTTDITLRVLQKYFGEL